MNVNLLRAVEDLGYYPGVGTDRKVFTFLAEHSTSKGIASFPQSVIARETGISKNTVPDSVHRLEDKGFLTVEKPVTDGIRNGNNIYHIAPWYLVHTKTAKRTTKPQCSACCECEQSERKHGQREHKLEITIDDVLAYSGANSQRIEGLWKRVTKLEDHQCDVDDRLARIGEVLTDVIHDLLAAYENKENTK